MSLISVKSRQMSTVWCLNKVPRTAAELLVSGQAALLLAVNAHSLTVFGSEFRLKCGCLSMDLYSFVYTVLREFLTPL